MMVTLWTGSAWGNTNCTTAWPASWYAVATRSSFSTLRLLLARPHRILSLASSRSSCSTKSLSASVAIIAASLISASKSAPLNIGVPRATRLNWTVGESLIFLACTSRIALRPSTSGNGTCTCLSKRPGLVSAGSSTSARFVAAITIT